MYPSRHRGFGALVLLVVLVLSGMAVLTTNAQAQGNQLVGLVYQCGSPATFIGGALVTLSDAQGIQDPRSVTTLADGTFTFSPLPGYYNVQVEKDGYFTETTASPIRFDDSATVDFNAEVPGFCLGSPPTAHKTGSLPIARTARGPRRRGLERGAPPRPRPAPPAALRSARHDAVRAESHHP